MLKFMKVAITYLNFVTDPTMCSLIISSVFTLKNTKKYTAIVRRILTKLIHREGLAKVNSLTPKEHQRLVAHVERERRKKHNIRERARLLALLGKK